MSKSSSSTPKHAPLPRFALYVDGLFVGKIPAHTRKSALVQAKHRYGSDGVTVEPVGTDVQDTAESAQVEARAA